MKKERKWGCCLDNIKFSGPGESLPMLPSVNREIFAFFVKWSDA